MSINYNIPCTLRGQSGRGWWVVGATLGAAGVVGASLLPLLPETRGCPMPETLADVVARAG